jgi:hypothetical protein
MWCRKYSENLMRKILFVFGYNIGTPEFMLQIREYIVTYVRFPWLNNVSTAVTMDSTTLLHFLSNATMETDVSMLHVTFP